MERLVQIVEAKFNDDDDDDDGGGGGDDDDGDDDADGDDDDDDDLFFIVIIVSMCFSLISHCYMLFMIVIRLVVTNILPYIRNVIIPTDELHHFSEGWRKTTNQGIVVIEYDGVDVDDHVGRLRTSPRS